MMDTTTTKTGTLPDEMRPEEAARYVGEGRSYFFALLKHGVVPSRYERGRRLIKRQNLDKFLEQRSGKTA